jgi:hypothetical protein
MDELISCKYCSNTFKTISSLNYHIKTNKKCIESRPITDTIETNNFECTFCNKIFYQKSALQRHLETCILKKKELLNKENISISNEIDKTNEIKRLKEEIEELKKIKEQNENLKKIIDDVKDENNKLKESVIEMKTEIRIKDEIIQRNDDQISELMKMSITTNNTMNNTTNNNVTIYAQIDALRPMNEFVECILNKKEFEKACISTSLRQPIGVLINVLYDFMLISDASRGKVNFRKEIDELSKRFFSQDLMAELRLSFFANDGVNNLFVSGKKEIRERMEYLFPKIDNNSCTCNEQEEYHRLSSCITTVDNLLLSSINAKGNQRLTDLVEKEIKEQFSKLRKLIK